MGSLISKIVQVILLGLIGLYRYTLSSFLGQNCRFYPSCSAYAQQAIREHGPVVGCKLAFMRLIRCHPGVPGGYDPVPCDSCDDSNPKQYTR